MRDQTNFDQTSGLTNRNNIQSEEEEKISREAARSERRNPFCILLPITMKASLRAILSGTKNTRGYRLFYYKREDSTLEEDFFIRSAASLIPVEVEAKSGKAKSISRSARTSLSNNTARISRKFIADRAITKRIP